MAAVGASRTKGTYLQARYKRLTSRSGPVKALVAVEHSIITVIWRMLTRLNELGYQVTLDPMEAAG